MKIAICDDEKLFLNKLYEYLCQEQDCTVECFTDPGVLLKHYEDGERFDVIFLDIKMRTLNGISLARKIRNFDAHVIIVFLTAYLEYAPAGYKVSAFRYLLKPISSKDIALVMKDIRHELRLSHKLMLKTPQCEMVLRSDDIIYLKADDKEITLYYSNDSLELHKSLNELAAQLPSELFFRIHRKYIVNLSHVREFDEKQLTLDCGTTLPISRRNFREFRNALNLYIEGGLLR